MLDPVLAVDEDEVIVIAWGVIVLYCGRDQTGADRVRTVVNQRLCKVAVICHSHHHGKREHHHNPVYRRSIDASHAGVEQDQVDDACGKQQVLAEGGPVAQVQCIAETPAVRNGSGNGQPQCHRCHYQHENQCQPGCAAAVGPHDKGDTQHELQCRQ